MNILKLIFIDEAIATCFEQKCGIAISYTIGMIFRLAEFGVVSAIPPIILNNYSNKYNTIIAAIASFFGMKFFSRLIEVFSQDSMPVVMKNLRESNKRLEDSNKRLEESNKRMETDIKNLRESNKRMETDIKNLRESNKRLETDIKNLKNEFAVDVIKNVSSNISKDIQNISKDIQNSFGKISYDSYNSYEIYDSPRNGD
jgi:hypothetical protein